jgi:hypothetical protein
MKPSVGRIVHVVEDGQPLPAIITKVHSDTCVNLRVFYDSNRNDAWRSSVTQGTAQGCWDWPVITLDKTAVPEAPAAIAQADGAGVCVK